MPTVVCSCGKTIEVKPEWAGSFIRCRGCAAKVYVPQAAEPPPTDPIPVAAETRACPFCAEQILKEAVKCRWCRRSLLLGRVPPPAPRPVPQDAGGMGILIVGILGWVLGCLGLILHPIAWAMGASHESSCRARGIEPSSAAKAGRILGMIGTIVWGSLFLLGVLFGLAGGSA